MCSFQLKNSSLYLQCFCFLCNLLWPSNGYSLFLNVSWII
uniref:Uncharacterized protein n=1 Tax=Rhizophora mucronata TaxID=61149 RepID=A0A2P2PDR9_RHIMU